MKPSISTVHHMNVSNRVFSTLFLFFCLIVTIAGDDNDGNIEQQQCDGNTGVCENAELSCSKVVQDSNVCVYTIDKNNKTSLYEAGGGTAQSYKPNAPIKNTVCEDDEKTISSGYHKVASWPYSRSSWNNKKYALPQISIKMNLLSCQPSTTDTGDCCCKPLLIEPNNNNTLVEIWQTRPDGTYSSLRKSIGEGECRARVPMTGGVDGTMSPAIAEFNTFPPGSTGSLGGIGPSKWEFSPYGPPVIHVFVSGTSTSADGVTWSIDPVLLDIPIFFDRKTLKQKTFKWRDWRGSSWMKSSISSNHKKVYNIVSWNEDKENNKISIDIELYLHQRQGQQYKSSEELSELFCPSQIYGVPRSFFVEPISICGPSLLDYFEL